MERKDWVERLLLPRDAGKVWNDIAKTLADIALASDDPLRLHGETVLPDRLLCEAAYPLWDAFINLAPKTSERLIRTCTKTDECAVLILDALSLREMSLIVNEARRRGIGTTSSVTFSEAPSDTDAFARALGATSRAQLKDDGKPAGFKPFEAQCRTDVHGVPFEDVRVEPSPRLLLWHSYLDDRIHYGHGAEELHTEARKAFTGYGFWNLIDRLRQGRRVVVTSDHGYGVAEQFSTEINDPTTAGFLRELFHGQRCVKSDPPPNRFMPPLFVFDGRHCLVTGQRRWKVSGGFPGICHGGLSLLEVASPWIELGPKR